MKRDLSLRLAAALFSLVTVGCQPIQPLAAPAADAIPVTQEAAIPIDQVLLLGSLPFYYPVQVGDMLDLLALSAVPPKEITARTVTLPDFATLQTHYLYSPYLSMRAIRQGGNDVVVLQDTLHYYSEKTTDPFMQSVQGLDTEIRNSGGRTVLYLEHPMESDWITFDEVVALHREAADTLNLAVAPAGLAIQRVVAERPDLGITGVDSPAGFARGMAMDEFPSETGVYLGALVLYATIFNEDPTGLAYRPAGLGEEDATYLQTVAWETVQEWRATP